MEKCLTWLGRKTGRKQPVSIFIFSWFALAEAVVGIISLGWWVPGWRAWALFSWEWFDDFTKRYDI
jgi:hypothetical protein